MESQIRLTAVDTTNNAEIDSEIVSLVIAKRAATFGARTPVVASLSNLSIARCRKIVREVTGQDPVKGQMPSDVQFYISDSERHLESIWLVKSYIALSMPNDSHVSNCECMFLAYKAYISHFNNPVINFDRFFMLIRYAIFNQEIKLVSCRECESNYLTVKIYNPNRSVKCPICSMSKG